MFSNLFVPWAEQGLATFYNLVQCASVKSKLSLQNFLALNNTNKFADRD